MILPILGVQVNLKPLAGLVLHVSPSAHGLPPTAGELSQFYLRPF